MRTYCGLFTTFFFTCYSFLAQAQSDNVGSGHMLEFNGTTDYVDLGNIYDDLQLPVTISAWIYITSDPDYRYPIFNSQDNLPIYNGITFAIAADRIGIQYGDGFGEGTGEFYRGKGATCPDLRNRWVHVCGVMKNANDMQLYVNGNDMGGSYGGYTSRPMGSNFPDDVAKIGYWYSNGATYKFKGKMDELRLWNRALTQEEVRETMCKKITESEPGLIGYWNFDELSGTEIFDQSANKFHGTIKGNPKRGFSGAPIGDESAYQYNANWTAKSVVSSDGKIEVNNVMNNPEGIHVYKVLNIPSQIGGITDAPSQEYYGIFSAATNVGKFFDVSLVEACNTFERNDNSNSIWKNSANPRISVPERVELILTPTPSPFKIDFGPDVILCDKNDYTITTGIDDLSGKSVEWSTGTNANSITVSTSGKYSATVKEGCLEDQDTIVVEFQKTPFSFSLGDDEVGCKFEARKLKPYSEQEDSFLFTWQDGSNLPEFEAKNFGEYWVNVKNACGSVSDTITFSEIRLENFQIPNVITPNGDGKNEVFELDSAFVGSKFMVFNRWGISVFDSNHYENNWNGSGESPGIYYYLLVNDCFDIKGSVTVIK